MRALRWGVLVVVLVLFGGGLAWFVLSKRTPPQPVCLATTEDGKSSYRLTPEQAQNAGTVAGVGLRLGVPDHAVTVAIATALQESKLYNLTGGDRDSAGLFQQRPSQGWGTYEQVTQPVYASEAFYNRLRQQKNWTDLTVTQAAQLVQHSAAPDAYAQWEPEARVIARALTGETAATFTCQNLTVGASSTSIVQIANSELGTAALSGAHDPARGWALSSWLVANAVRFGLDKVTFDGRTWTPADGTWSQGGTADGTLSLHQVPATS
ncbi:hypothetical protein FPZ12_043005 [Amycolatopsis acidicola]|uniref:Heavy metal transporter n=1 Tax=Amycolatopsis acidicola TaxID=2596893 RepID=A0A5N0UKB8_9PSEU|nr:hypothetical protein [Amycolatopsis acidicola]KAA9149562.1 hypothetical protein FPZ12_043005 [Amycolatopsis acidicola]